MPLVRPLRCPEAPGPGPSIKALGGPGFSTEHPGVCGRQHGCHQLRATSQGISAHATWQVTSRATRPSRAGANLTCGVRSGPRDEAAAAGRVASWLRTPAPVQTASPRHSALKGASSRPREAKPLSPRCPAAEPGLGPAQGRRRRVTEAWPGSFSGRCSALRAPATPAGRRRRRWPQTTGPEDSRCPGAAGHST